MSEYVQKLQTQIAEARLAIAQYREKCLHKKAVIVGAGDQYCDDCGVLLVRLPKLTKDAVVARIKEVECNSSSSVSQRPWPSSPSPAPLPPHVAAQSPSTQALMMKHGDIAPMAVAPPAEPLPVAVIAQTPAAVAAMASRASAIADSMNGKTDKQTGRPRKF